MFFVMFVLKLEDEEGKKQCSAICEISGILCVPRYQWKINMSHINVHLSIYRLRGDIEIRIY